MIVRGLPEGPVSVRRTLPPGLAMRMREEQRYRQLRGKPALIKVEINLGHKHHVKGAPFRT